MANRNSPPVTTECKSVLLYSVWIRTLAGAVTDTKSLLKLPDNRLTARSRPSRSPHQMAQFDPRRSLGPDCNIDPSCPNASFETTPLNRRVGWIVLKKSVLG